MRETEVRERAFAMPLTNPAYSPGPYRFVNREYLIITYRTDAAKLRAVVPEPLEFDAREALVAGFDRFRRLHGKRSGDSSLLPRPQGRLHPLHVP
jgi:acetoacetate decarboxylase